MPSNPVAFPATPCSILRKLDPVREFGRPVNRDGFAAVRTGNPLFGKRELAMPVVNRATLTNDHVEADVEVAAKAIIGAVTAKRPLPSPAFRRHFGVFNCHLIAVSVEILIHLGVRNLDEAAKVAVERFYREMLATTDFKNFLASDGTPPFSVVARKALRKICAKISQAAEFGGTE
jgi:hypothetical protein